jgi:hypothetical protein
MMTDLTAPDLFFDQMLEEILAGNSVQTIPFLAGVLDAIAADPIRSEDWRAAFLHHSLKSVLGRNDVKEAINWLGFARGLVARKALASAQLNIAKHAGKLALQLPAIPHQEVPAVDLIIADGMGDIAERDELPELLLPLVKTLRENGTLIISSFAPGYIGHGWQSIFLDQKIRCHDEADLEKVAHALGLGMTSFRDGSNSVIWAELFTHSNKIRGNGGFL